MTLFSSQGRSPGAGASAARFSPALRRDLRIALFRWRRLLAAVITVASLAAAGVATALPSAMRTAGDGRSASSPSPGAGTETPQPGETVLVVRVPEAEASRLRAGDTVLVVSLKRHSAQDRQEPGRVLWKEDPPGGLGVERAAARKESVLGVAVRTEAASALAASVRQGEVMLTSRPR